MMKSRVDKVCNKRKNEVMGMDDDK